MPALLTSTSMGPLASSAAAMDSRFVTSSATTRSRSDWCRTSSRGARMVATTSQPCEWKWRAVSRPYPEEQPVMSAVLCTGPSEVIALSLIDSLLVMQRANQPVGMER